MPGAKHYRIKNNKKVFIFSGISKRQFRELPNARVVGYFSDKMDNEKYIYEGLQNRFSIKKNRRGRNEKVEFEVYNTPHRFRRTVCYVPIGEDEFLVYEKRAIRYIAGPVTAVACAAILAYIFFGGVDTANPLGIAPTVNIGGDGKQEKGDQAMIDFAGYDSIEVSADNPYVLLQNPESNDVYFSYVVYDEGGKEIMKTDLIPPGKALQWAAANDLGNGEHEVNMHVDTYDMKDTSIPYNAMNYDKVKVIID